MHTPLLPSILAAEKCLRSVRLAFIGGQGKSGTTWVERLIDAHPQGACLGEGHFAEGLGQRIYAALTEYNRFVEYNNAQFPELEDFPQLAANDSIELVRAALLLQFQRIAMRNPDARVVAVRTPSELNRVTELSTILPQAVFVHVLRDPRDIAISLWWHGERLAPGSMLRRHGSPEMLARELVPNWAAHVVHMRGLDAASQGRLFEIRYERLLDTPIVETEALFAFLGLAHTPEDCSTVMTACRFERFSGGRAPGQADATSHCRSGTSGQWRDQMPASPPGGWSKQVEEVFESLGYQC
ncbi:MAG: sulfotransferase [Lysobacteraceae bacterium]